MQDELERYPAEVSGLHGHCSQGGDPQGAGKSPGKAKDTGRTGVCNSLMKATGCDQERSKGGQGVAANTSGQAASTTPRAGKRKGKGQSSKASKTLRTASAATE
eukprot:548360-Amphidinium_carterae.1